MLKQLFITISVFIVLPAFSVMLNANQGKVIFLKGSGTIIRSGSKLNIRIGMKVIQKDTLLTNNKSFMIVKLDNGSRLKLKANTQISFTTLSKKRKTKLYLHKGGLFAKVNKLRKNQNFQVQSITATAGVRGTLFYMHTLKTNDIWLCVNDGEVEVYESGSRSKALVKPGMGISVMENKKIEKPKAYAWTKKLNWNMDTEKGDAEDHIDLDTVYDILDIDYD